MMKQILQSLLVLVGISSGQIMQSNVFQPFNGDVMNPERGWMEPNNADDGESSYRNKGH